MRHFKLAFVVFVLFSAAGLAQHNAGGGGGGSSSGGSHGGGSPAGGGSIPSSSGGGSSYNGGSSHSGSSSGGGSSAGSPSHGSAGSSSHGSSGYSPHSSGNNSPGSSNSGSVTPHGSRQPSHSNAVVLDQESRRQLKAMVEAGKSRKEIESFVRSKANTPSGRLLSNKVERPEKRSFFSILRHPFHKAESKPVADLRRPICIEGRCRVCPSGLRNGRGGCVGTFAHNSGRWLLPKDPCSRRDAWRDNSCLQRMNFLEDCSASRFALDQQLQHLRAAESARDSACSAGTPQECSDLSLKANSESSLYRSLSERYKQCRQGQWQNYPMTPLPNSTSDPMLTGLDDH